MVADYNCDDDAFGAHVCAGLKLEYSAQRVVVKRSLELMPVAPALAPVLGKRYAEGARTGCEAHVAPVPRQ